MSTRKAIKDNFALSNNDIDLTNCISFVAITSPISVQKLKQIIKRYSYRYPFPQHLDHPEQPFRSKEQDEDKYNKVNDRFKCGIEKESRKRLDYPNDETSDKSP